MECSGTQANRKEEAFEDLFEEAEEGRSEASPPEGFSCIRAMKPGMLSLAEGVGWT